MDNIGKIKIGLSLRNFRDRIRSSVSVKRRNVLFFVALVLVIVVAIMIRLTPVFRGPLLIKAFDPWMQYYHAKYITEHTLYEYFHWYDYKSWYPEGRDRAGLRPGLPFTAAAIYFILNFIGIPITIYEVCYFLPPVMGGMTVLAGYFLGKEIYDRNCGLLTAFFIAFNPGHCQRTMAGFFDNETIGVFATLMVFFFFLKAIKTGRFSHSIIAGVFLGYLSLSWGGFQFVFFILPIIVFVLILLNKYDENVFIAYAGTIGTGFLIQGLGYNFSFNAIFESLSSGGVFLFIIVLIFFHLIYTKKSRYPRFYNLFLNSVKWLAVPAFIVIAIIIWINPDLIPLGIGPRLNSVLSPLVRDKMHLVASVAEHMPSAWSIFYYNTLIPLILLPLGIFFCFKRLEAADILLMTFLLTIFYFTGSMIRIILLFGPAASLMGAYGLVNILKIYGNFLGERRISTSRKRRRQLRRTVGRSEVFSVYFLVGFLCIAQVFHATDISINQLSYSQMVTGGEFHDWEDALTWMKNNLDGTDVVVSWWDYGYWLTPIGNVTTVNDNDTSSSKRIGLTGMALMQTNEIYSAKILKELHADYVLVYFGFLISGMGGDEGKWPWMLRICNDFYESYVDDGLEEDNWAEDSVFLEREYINETSGQYEDKWFQSQLVRLMFYGEPTSPSGINPNTHYLEWYYASQIGGNPSQNIDPREDDNGNEWADHIPPNGAYDFKVFKPTYFSSNGMVKIFQVDYTALESSFEIVNPKVYDIGAASFSLSNTGTKDLSILGVEINDIPYNFTMGRSDEDKKLNTAEEDIVWVDMPVPYAENDVFNITVTAEAEALAGTTYLFDETTANDFVIKTEPGAIKINRENSKVEQHGDLADVILEVENIGLNTIINIENFYVNNKQNSYTATSYETGASVLRPGEKAKVIIEDVQGWFNPDQLDPYLKGNLIGVKTSQGVYDETIFSYNSENYKLAILGQERTLTIENEATSSNMTYRYYIPMDYANTDTYALTNGDIKIRVKNLSPSKLMGINEVYVARAADVKYGNIFNLTSDKLIAPKNILKNNPDLVLYPQEEKTIIIEGQYLPSGLSNIALNEELIIAVAAKGDDLGYSIASDIGVLHAIKNEPNITIVEEYDGLTKSYIAANETGKLLIKNTGNEIVNLTSVVLNDTLTLDIYNNVTFIYGDRILATGECAYISFNIDGLEINATNYIKVNVTTNTTAQDIHVFQAIVNSNYYNIDIDTVGSSAGSNFITIKIDNEGQRTLNVDSIYINNTRIPLSNFTFDVGSSYTIDSVDSITLRNTLWGIEYYLGLNPGDIIQGYTLVILVRTKEGAEDEYIVSVGV